MWDIQLFKLNFDEREVEAVSAVVDGKWLTMGENTARFEAEFEKFLGENVNCCAVSSCTAALHMALLALDIGPGDEVIIPSLTFIADINVVELVGATPKLADSHSLETWNVSLETISRQITENTKAIILVHYAGYPCQDIKEITKLCKEKGIALIEDVAHAPGASLEGQKCGTFGDIGCFSFFSNKNLSIGEGGMVSTRNPELHEKIGFIRSHGMTSLTLDRHKGRAISYDVVRSGLNYRMDEMRAALGLVQLGKLDAGNLRRADLTARYRENFLHTDISVPFSNCTDNSISSYHILPILLPPNVSRNVVVKSLKASGIQSSIHYPPFWNFSAYKNRFKKESFPISATICERQLTLPLFPTMTIPEVDRVTTELITLV